GLGEVGGKGWWWGGRGWGDRWASRSRRHAAARHPTGTQEPHQGRHLDTEVARELARGPRPVHVSPRPPALHGTTQRSSAPALKARDVVAKMPDVITVAPAHHRPQPLR